MVLLVPIVALSGCTSSDDAVVPDGTTPVPTGETAVPVPRVLSVEIDDIVQLTDPPGGLHHHATVAWGATGYQVAWTAGFDPDTGAWTQPFDEGGAERSGPLQLNTDPMHGDKPDVVWTGTGFVVAWDDRQGGVWLRALDVDGAPSLPSTQLHQSGLVVDAVDLAVQGDGSGTAIWTESGAVWMGPDDGRIVWRDFDSGLGAVGLERIAESSSRKTPDAAPLSGGGFVGVWARHYDHPLLVGEVLYEVHGRLYRGDGTTRSFRADDLDDAWPSRPAVAVHEDGRMAVSWRDKTSSEGDPAGAYGRLFDPEGIPLGASMALGPGGDGDRVVVAWAGDLAVFSWQETATDGLPAVWMSVVDGDTGGILADRLELSEPGSDRDERPSIDVRAVEGGHEVLAIWETVIVGTGLGDGLRTRRIRLLTEE